MEAQQGLSLTHCWLSVHLLHRAHHSWVHSEFPYNADCRVLGCERGGWKDLWLRTGSCRITSILYWPLHWEAQACLRSDTSLLLMNNIILCGQESRISKGLSHVERGAFWNSETWRGAAMWGTTWEEKPRSVWGEHRHREVGCAWDTRVREGALKRGDLGKGLSEVSRPYLLREG